ncbi:Uncharacterised protein [Mammaliicoccus fleurettii]|nr:Uncharacterised protein [Mammaliicoccus fleurettii]
MTTNQAENIIRKRCEHFNMQVTQIHCTQLVDYGNYYIIYANIDNICRKFPVYKSAI